MLRGMTIAVLALLLSFTISVGIYAVAFQELLEPKIYTDALEKHDAYSALEERLPDEIPISDPQGLIETLILNTLSYINGDAEDLELKVSLNVTSSISKLLSDVPECTDNVTEDCLPPGMNGSETLALLAEQGYPVEMIEEPFEIDIAEELELASPAAAARQNVAYFKFGLRLLAALAVILAALILFIARPLKAGVRAIDADLIIVGSGAVISGLLLQDRLVALLPGQYGVLEDVLVTVMGGVLHLLVVYGGIVLAVGALTLIATSFSIEKR